MGADIVLLTEDRYENPVADTEYVQNIIHEDKLLRAALENRGLTVARKNWRDKNFDWSTAKYLMFRTTWDYFDRYNEFMTWLDATAQKTQFINSIKTIRWNLDKHYLHDLLKKGIRIVETCFIEKGSQVSLKELHRQLEWTQSILKPAVSGAARNTFRLDENNLEDHETIFSELIAQQSMLLQPFLEHILTDGEITLVVIDGKYTHAVQKKAKPGDFRVQDDFGGTVHDYQPSEQEIQFAEEIMAAINPVPLYGRVDLILDNDHQLAVSELELIEPELWFRTYPPAAEQLADAIARLF